MDLHAEMLLSDFVDQRPIYEKVKALALEIINGVISENKMYVVAVEARVKAVDSLAGKLALKGYKYNSIRDITDLVGTRIVTFYEEEVDKVAAFIEKNFDIDWSDSVDKRKLYENENSDRFGYMSLHYIISIPKSYYYDENCPEINEIKFEIQMRTALQHIWATAAHDTGYKSDIEIPKRYIRKLNRLAGLLEIADKEFSEMLGEISEYRRKVTQLVADGNYKELHIDGDTFAAYLDIGPYDNLVKRVAKINKAEISKENITGYIEVFNYLGITTIGELVDMRDRYEEMAYQLSLSQLAGTDIDILSSSIGIKNICLAYIYDNQMGMNGFIKFFDIINGPNSLNAMRAERAMKAFERLPSYSK